MSSEMVFFSSSSRSIRSTKAFNWSLANLVLAASGASFSTADIQTLLVECGRGTAPASRRGELKIHPAGARRSGVEVRPMPVIHRRGVGKALQLDRGEPDHRSEHRAPKARHEPPDPV